MSSDSLGRSASQRTIRDKEGLTLVPIRQNVTEKKGGAGSTAAAIGALVVLWCYYAGFGLLWLEAFTQMGDDLLWAYFGVFTVVATSMGAGVAFSMSAQRVGWWTKSDNKKRDERGTCCGFQVY